MGDGLSVLEAQWSGGVGVWVLCVFVSLCVCSFFRPTTNFPLYPPLILLFFCFHWHTPLSPPPIYPLPLSFSPFCLDEKILILMALRLFFFFFFDTTVVRWPFLHATRMQPSDRRAKSAHLHTHALCTRSCTHTLSHTHRRLRA